jgi:hypothetical protein
MTKPKATKYLRGIIVQTRLDNDEMQDAITKAAMYSRGNVSELIRMAVKAYRPIKKVGVK